MASSSSKHRGCLNKTNSFCYVCGEFTTAAHRQTITTLLSTAYFHYFKCKIGDQDKIWAPHICCNSCYVGVVNWFKGKKVVFKFAVPMVWREPPNHIDDCYFCLTKTSGFTASSRKKINYPNLSSVMRPIPYTEDLPILTPPVVEDLLYESDDEPPLKNNDFTSSAICGGKPHLISQKDLNDLVCDLYLSIQHSELLASQLKQWNLVQEDIRITSRHRDFTSLFSMEKSLCYCTSVPDLFTSLGFTHDPSDWRLFIDS